MAERAAPTVPDPVSSLDEFVSAYVDAWNSHDADRLLAFLHPNVVYDDSTWPRTMRGHADVREFLAIPAPESRLGRLAVAGQRLAARVRVG